MKCFKLNLLETQNLEQVTLEKYRYYEKADGKKFPSVTSILSLNEPKELKEWKERVGKEEAERVSKKATTRGSKLHAMCEYYLQNDIKNHVDKFTDYDIMAFNRIKKYVDLIDEVFIIEGRLYSEKLRCSGTVDAFGTFLHGKELALTTIDFKTSKKVKNETDIENYFIQTTIYSQMIHEIYGILPKYITIIIDNEFDPPSLFSKRINETKEYYDKFLSLRKNFYAKHGF